MPGRQVLGASLALLLATSVSATPPIRIALNASTCAQEMENYRLACEQSCDKQVMKSAQCRKDCNDPKKLLQRLSACEKRENGASRKRSE